MIYKCSKCGKKIRQNQNHVINFSNQNLCNDCYTDKIRKEEDYYDFCSSIGSYYNEPSEDNEEPLDLKAFYAK